MKKILILFVLASSFILGCAGDKDKRNENTEKAPDKLDISTLGDVDNVFPSPGELISAAGKLGTNVNWNQLAAYSSKSDYASKEAKALNLGIRVADAFVAVYAEDKTNLQSQNDAISKLSEGLGASAIAGPFKSQADKLIQEGKWKELRTMMDNLYFQLQPQGAEAEEGDQTISALTASGALLEGLSVVSTQLAKSYNKDGSSLLNQGELLEDCVDKINKLNSTNTLIKDTKTGLQSILSTLGGAEVKDISQDQAAKISTIAKGLIQKIIGA